MDGVLRSGCLTSAAAVRGEDRGSCSPALATMDHRGLRPMGGAVVNQCPEPETGRWLPIAGGLRLLMAVA
jgi:hypothetical protein